MRIGDRQRLSKYVADLFKLDRKLPGLFFPRITDNDEIRASDFNPGFVPGASRRFWDQDGREY